MGNILSKNKAYYLHILIFLAITFGVGFLPPFAQITPLGMKVLGVFFGIVYGWMFLGLAWPSLIGLVFLGLVGYGEGGINGLFISGFSFQVLPQMILCYLLADGIAQTKFTDYVANKLLKIKLFAGKPFVLMGGFLVGLDIMMVLHCGLAGLFLLWVVCKNIAEKAGYEKRNLFCTVMVASTIVIYVFGAMIFPFSPGPLMQITFFKQGMQGIEVPFFGWIIWWLVYTLVYAVLWPLFCKYILRLNFDAIAVLGDVTGDLSNVGNQEKLNADQKFGLAILIGFMIFMLAPELLPNSWFITKFLHSLGLTGSLTVAIVIMASYRRADGTNFLSLQSAAKSLSWDVIWLMIATEPLAAALNAQECGIMASVMSSVTPMLMSLSPTIFLIACVVVLGAVTQVIHNLVLMVVFIPLLCPLYAQMGGNPFVMFLALVVALNSAFATPAASWNSAMMFGESSIITSKMYLQGTLNFVFTVVLFLIIGLPLAKICLGF